VAVDTESTFPKRDQAESLVEGTVVRDLGRRIPMDSAGFLINLSKLHITYLISPHAART
jgi:hypothetical protein